MSCPGVGQIYHRYSGYCGAQSAFVLPGDGVSQVSTIACRGVADITSATADAALLKKLKGGLVSELIRYSRVEREAGRHYR